MPDRRQIKKLAVFIPLFVIVLLIVIFLISFRMENIEVVTGEHYTENEIKKLVFTHVTDEYTYLFALRAKLFGLDSVPFVEKIDYEVVDKNTVRLYVYERQIAGSVLVMGRYFCFDREGIITDSTDVPPEGVVLVTGIDVGDVVIGTRIDSTADVFKNLMGLVSLINKNKIEVREIAYDFRGNITLMIDDDEVLLGKKDDYDLEMNNLRNIMSSMGEGAYRFDLRYMNNENMSVTAKPIEN